MTINRLNQGVTNQVLVKAVSGQTTPLLELQDSSGNVVSSIGPTGALGGTLGDSGLVHINTTSFSAVASQSLDNVFTSTYKNYRILLNGVSSTTNVILVRMRASGTDNSTANYQRQRFQVADTVTAGARETNQTSGRFAFFLTTEGFWSIDMANPAEAVETQWNLIGNGTPGTGITVSIEASSHNVASAFDGLTIYVASGTITGTISIYGYKE